MGEERQRNERALDGTRKRDGGSEGYGACLDEVGIDWSEGPPVPIPNTEVKLSSVDDSMRATACENR